MFRGHVVFTLVLVEAQQGNSRLLGEGLDLSNEPLTDRGHQGGGSESVSAMESEERGHSPVVLEPGDVHVEVHAVNAFQIQGDVLADDFRDGLW